MKNSLNSAVSPAVSPIVSPLSHKSTLARLLATENINIIHQKVQTAMFNLKTRTLVLPMWATDDISLYDMLVGHEVSHALHTNPDEWKAGIATVVGVTKITEVQAMSYLNIVEDARIERLIKTKFPGLRRDFYAAYATLLNRKFFGDLSNIAAMCFADRINLQSKMGIHGGLYVPFSAEETPIAFEVTMTNTFDDVVRVAIAIIELQIQQSQEHPEHPEEDSDSDSDSEMKETEDSGDDIADGEYEQTDDVQEKKIEMPMQQNKKTNTPSIPSPLTNETMEKEIAKQLTDSSDSPEIIRIPVPGSHNTVIDYKDIIEDVTYLFNLKSNESYTKQLGDKFWSPIRIADFKSASNAMSMAFNRKKAADLFKRSTVARTGALDTLRMNQYRWTDDIFRRTVKISQGKNHGVIILLDWSGSMSSIMQSTIGQLFILTDFCRDAGIPFEVFAFSDQIWTVSSLNSTETTAVQKIRADEYSLTPASLSPISLLNFLSSRMSTSDYNKGKSILWNWRNVQRFNLSNNQSTYNYHLSGTPTNSALFEISAIISSFVRRTGIQIPHCVVLTDGEPSDDIRLNQDWAMKRDTELELGTDVEATVTENADKRWRRVYHSVVVLDDPMTGCSYDLTFRPRPTCPPHNTDAPIGTRRQMSFSHGSVEVPFGEDVKDVSIWIACDIIRRRTGAQIHWIGLNNSRACPSSREKMKTDRGADWKRDGFVRGTCNGWDSAIIINSDKFGRDSDGAITNTVRSNQAAANQLFDKATTRAGLQKAFAATRSVTGGLRVVAASIGERLAV